MSDRKKSEGDLVFNDDFDKQEPAVYVPPPAPAPPPQTAATVSTPAATVEIPEVEEDAAVPSVTPKKSTATPPPQKEKLEKDDLVLDFTDSTAAPVTAGHIEPGEGGEAAPSGDADNENEQERGRWGWFSLKPFQKYFEVDDRDVLLRLGSAMKGPFKASFANLTQHNPDLYGPFWIATTLVFLTVVSSSLGSYSKHKRSEDKNKDWDGDYSKLGESALMFYIYLFGVGLMLYFTLRFYSSTMQLSHIWCIYGYSMTPLLPTLVAIALVQLLEDRGLADGLTLVLAIVGTIYSGSFLIMNFHSEMDPGRQKTVLLVIMVLVHLVIGLLIALYFH